MADGSTDFTGRNLSYSQIVEWMNCPHKHNLSYIQGYRPKSDGIPLMFGSFFHEGIAADIRGEGVRKSVEDAATKASEKLSSPLLIGVLEDTAEQAIEVVYRASEWMAIHSAWETVSLNGEPLIEVKMDVPIEGWQNYVGIGDWVARNRYNGKTYLIDWKTRGRLSDPRNEELNLQLMSYLAMFAQLGLTIDEAAIVQVLSKLPVRPKLNKDGTMSRAKIATDWMTYEEALIENGLDPDDYFTMREKLDAQFFEFVELYFSPQEIKSAWDTIIYPSSQAIIQDETRMRHMSPWNCRNCAFKQPCLEDLRGYDPTDTLERHFERKIA